MKQDWVWMPHAGHLCVGHMCRFRLNTYVNGYIVSTVGEYFPDQDVRRMYIKHRVNFPKLRLNEEGKVEREQELTEKDAEKLLSLKGDHFDAVYLKMFGYENIGASDWEKYETMVFKARKVEHSCCEYQAVEGGDILECERYPTPESAYAGHLQTCEKWDSEVHSSKYVQNDPSKMDERTD